MTDTEFYNLRNIKDEIDYWKERLEKLNAIRKHAEEDRNCYVDEKIALYIPKKKKPKGQIGIGCSSGWQYLTMPIGCADAVIKYAEEQLKIAQERFNAIQIKETNK